MSAKLLKVLKKLLTTIYKCLHICQPFESVCIAGTMQFEESCVELSQEPPCHSCKDRARDVIRQYEAECKQKQQAGAKLNKRLCSTGNNDINEHKRCNICNEVVHYFDACTRGLNSTIKKEVFDQLLLHPYFKEVIESREV